MTSASSARRGCGWRRTDGGKGLTGWSLRDLEDTELDGLATTRSDRPPPRSGRLTPTASARSTTWSRSAPTSIAPSPPCRRAGLDLRRIREEPTPAGAPRQAFFRLGEPILEVVQAPAEAIERTGGDRPAFFWGLAFVAPDLEATVASLGDRVSEVRDAVQPGRRIATLRRSAGLSLPVALITPPRQGSAAGGRRSSTLKPQSRRRRAAISERWQASGSRSTQSRAAFEPPIHLTIGARSTRSRISSV